MVGYLSTNGKSKANGFGEVLLKGLASDKGLFMPTQIPKLPDSTLDSMLEQSYPEIAFTVMREFLKQEIEDEVLMGLIKDAYDFDVPLQKIVDNQHILWLDEGPTAAFKDFAARMMARLMQHYNRGREENLVILTATSGDTGGAVASAFYDLKGIDVIVLFPKDEVTHMQRRQMTTLGANITAIGLDGKFDDCQAIVKSAFADPRFRSIRLTSANSINFGRLLPQTVYYFYGWSKVNEEVVFSVPCGNFGNLMGGLIAMEMGLPVKKFVVATNENDEFLRFINSGQYKPIVPSRACISNAMNVGHPSNLVRLIYLYNGEMDEEGTIKKTPDMIAMNKDLFVTSVTDDATRQTIKRVYEDYGVILEPHGAVGWAGMQRYLEKERTDLPAICLETADPGKFPKEIVNAIGIEPPIPKSLRDLEKKSEYMSDLPNDYPAFRKLLEDRYLS